jgi:protein PhnA
MSDPRCPKCNYEYTYHNGQVQVCTDCNHEWDPNAVVAEETAASSDKVLDANGNELVDGDTVVVMKDLPVKGALRPVKAGTKVKNIKLVEGDHNISCKIDGFGSMGLKSEFVKKA